MPNLDIMSDTLISGRPYANRRIKSTVPTNSVVALCYDSVHPNWVFDTDRLLEILDERGVKNVQIAKALGLPDSRIPEIRQKRRALKLDEAAKLVRAFELEEGREVPALPPAVMRLVVRHVANCLRIQPSEQQVADIAEDLRAFGSFVADRKVRQSIEAAEGFFQAMRFRRQGSEEEAQQETDPRRGR